MPPRLVFIKFIELSNYSILNGLIYGLANNLLSPTIAIDPRVRSLNSSSFYNTPGHGLIEKVINFVRHNNKWYLAFLAIGVTTSIFFVLLQATGFILIFKSNHLLGLLIMFYVMYFLIICGFGLRFSEVVELGYLFANSNASSSGSSTNK
mgnify:CR=1 FL=1